MSTFPNSPTLLEGGIVLDRDYLFGSCQGNAWIGDGR